MTNGEAFIGLMTLLLAAATFALALQTKGSRDDARAGEIARQRETRILAVRPLLVAEPEVRPPTEDGRVFASMKLVTRESPVLDVTVVVRGVPPEGDGSTGHITEPGSLPPESEETATVELQPMLDSSTGKTWGRGLEVVLTHYGLLGQRVVEHYEWNYNARGALDRAWRLYRLEIDPRGVAGADSFDREFGEAPIFNFERQTQPY